MIFAVFSLNQQISKAQKTRGYYTQKSSQQLIASLQEESIERPVKPGGIVMRAGEHRPER